MTSKAKKWFWIGGGVVVVILLAVVGGPFVYIHFIEPDPAPKLALSDSPTTTSQSGQAGQAGQQSSDPSRAPLAGTWNVGDGSKAQYRVKEVLFGQDNEATGTTTDVTGAVIITGTTVDSAMVTVDLSTMSSDESNRDRQFRGRIMNTDQFPDATFKLTQPIALGKEPAEGEKVTVTATGDLTMHGTTKSVTAQLDARRTGNTIEIAGTIPVTFSDFGINDPSGGPAQVGNTGDIEILLDLTPASAA